MPTHDQVDEDAVRALARIAALPLDDNRLPALTALLQTWLPAANELSRAMSAAEHREAVPITVVAHLAAEPQE